MSFDPKQHLIRVQGGREYLPVSARLVWFRSEHPDWGIVTEAVEINLEKQYAIFRANIFNAEGKLMATATKMENVRGFGDWLEKCETGSIGRALAYCGFGTQFAPEIEEGQDRPADAPQPSRQSAQPASNGRNGRVETPALPTGAVPCVACGKPVPPARASMRRQAGKPITCPRCGDAPVSTPAPTDDEPLTDPFAETDVYAEGGDPEPDTAPGELLAVPADPEPVYNYATAEPRGKGRAR